jgi:competence protein ComFC
MHSFFTRTAPQLLFAPRCWACGGNLSAGRDFCFRCRREIFRALEREGCLLRYEGAVAGLFACLRGTAPKLGAAWCLALLARSGQLENWRQENFSAVALAPQNPKAGERGLFLVGKAIAAELKIPLWQPFTKVGRRTQHGKSLAERMDAACFVKLHRQVSGSKILLLDDVLTTGTTLEQCAYLLRKSGGAEVEVFSLAKQMMPSFERKQGEARHESEEVNPLLLHLFV